MRVMMIDGPSDFDTLEIWERHLAWLRSLPKDVMLLQEMIAHAEWLIKEKEKEREEDSQKNPRISPAGS